MSLLLKRAEDAEQFAHSLLLFAAKLRETAAEEGALEAPFDLIDPKRVAARDTGMSMLQSARRIYRARRKREVYFDPDLFGEPAWDILLDLYAAFVTDRDISVSSVYLASNVPATTALRWVALLEQRGLVTRQRAPHDARVLYARLTKGAAIAMRKYLLEIENTHSRQQTTFMLAGD